jgi:hypothetical protein
MTHLYSCRHSGDQYRITKFTSDLEVESSYLCTVAECECPAGVQPTCRHRKMLPKFLQRDAVDTDWMFDYDRGGWVQMAFGEPASLGEQSREVTGSEPVVDLSREVPATAWRRGL